MELNICHLYPDILNLYGDRGNIITMKRRLESRGISVNVDECSIGQPLDVDKYDIFFIGAINVHTIGAKERMIGNYMYRTTPESSGSIVVGFENHSGKTYLGEDVAPLGMMIKGYGNNGEDQTEGARYNNVFATYSHGSLLPKNPVLCDFILQTALDRRYGKTEPLVPLNDTLELNAHNYMEQRLSK